MQTLNHPLDSIEMHSREKKLNGREKEEVGVFVVWWTRERYLQCFVESSTHEIELMLLMLSTLDVVQ